MQSFMGRTLLGRVRHFITAIGSIHRDRAFLREFSGERAGGFLVLESKFLVGHGKVRWERLLFFFGLAAALAILSSCGSASTAVAPSITASCISTEGSGSDVTVLGTAQC